jgi:hypothetical protein
MLSRARDPCIICIKLVTPSRKPELLLKQRQAPLRAYRIEKRIHANFNYSRVAIRNHTLKRGQCELLLPALSADLSLLVERSVSPNLHEPQQLIRPTAVP